MNTPYPWTKQITHLGGTRDGMIVRWGNGIAARGEVRHQWHHVIDVLPTILESAGIEAPETYGGVVQQPVEGTSLHYTFADADADERHTTQYFEMVGNRGVYHEGWTAVTRHGIPWEMVGGTGRPFEEDVWELYDHARDWSQAHDLAAEHPDKLRELQDIFQREAEKYHVLPLDDRVTERENPEVAGRLDLHFGRSSLSFGPRVGRLTEEAAPNVKNRSHLITADLEIVTGTNGVVVAQGGRFGGWSLYLLGGIPHYAYNNLGRDLNVVRGGKPMTPGRHDLVVRFAYDGGPPGSGAEVSLEVDGARVGSGRIPATTAYYFSFDETFNVGVDRGTPVVDDYLPVRNAFQGLIHSVRFDLDEVADPGTDEGRERAVMVHQ